MPRDDLRSYRYQRARAAFLADKIACYWCGAEDRKLTIDHMIPVALMSEHDDLTPMDVDNWVAACSTCNAKRGAMITNAKRAEGRKGRPAAGFSNYPRPSRDW
jgi:hypothetical protein